jgi:hypothetical protein
LSGSADEGGRVRLVVGQRHLPGVGPLDDVIVSDNVSVPVPYEAAASAARHLPDVEAQSVAALLQRGDVNDRRSDLAVDLDGRFFVRGEVAAGGTACGCRTTSIARNSQTAR